MSQNTGMRGLLWLSFLALPLLAGCWQPRYFAPRENQNGTGPNGQPAAVYRVSRADAPGVAGEVRVWSDGARARFTEDDEEVVDLHVGFEIENTGESALELAVEDVRLEELMVDGYLQDQQSALEVRGSGYAPAGSTARLDLMFRPATTKPRAVDGFAVRFAVRDDEGAVVSQVTPFAPSRRSPRYVATDPYWWGWGYGWGPYPYWGWGPGWGLGPTWGWGVGYRICR